MHIMLVLSPVGDQFRTRIRTYPNIINCTTLNWMKQWPEEALSAVARKFINELYIEKAATKTHLATFCIHMHTSTIQLNDKFFQKEGRQIYITPSSYLELMKLFQSYLQIQQNKLKDNLNVYATGVAKLVTTQ